MDALTLIRDYVVQVGFPIAVATALLWGLHYWTARAYRDVLMPLAQAQIKTLQATRVQLARIAESAELIAQHYTNHGSSKGE